MTLHSIMAAPALRSIWPNRERAPVVRLRGARRRLALQRILLMGCVALVAVLGLASLVPSLDRKAPLPPQAPAGPAASDWLEISHPLPLYGLSGSSFARLPLVYEARRRVMGLERRDVLTFGTAGPQSAYLRLTFARSRQPASAAIEPPADLVVDFARIAGGNGLALMRAGVPTALPSRFGPFDIADLTLRGQSGDAACFGFRLQSATPIAIAGLACGSAAQPLDKAGLGCLLDRIDLLSAADDPILRDVFVEAERRRGQACPGASGR